MAASSTISGSIHRAAFEMRPDRPAEPFRQSEAILQGGVSRHRFDVRKINHPIIWHPFSSIRGQRPQRFRVCGMRRGPRFRPAVFAHNTGLEGEI
jgi:hypothetical protein